MRVCCFTGSRADFGPLLPVIDKLRDDPEVHAQILATGSHLLTQQGFTVSEIENLGHPVSDTVDIVLASDTPTAIAKSFGLGVIGYADALERLDPDVLVIVGDRYEALAAAVTAAVRLLPIAHIGGGEVTIGSTDDSVRHAITKLAQLHFTATEEFRHRVIQLGEDPGKVYTTGGPALDTIRTFANLTKLEIEHKLTTELTYPTLLVTYHPATADPKGSTEGLQGLLKALDSFPQATVVFTATNVDHGGFNITTYIRRYVELNPQRAIIWPSLGQRAYFSLVKLADAVVGNSSSGIAEAPALHTPTVNIGSRQSGRPRAASVIDCGESSESIEQAIQQALSSEHRKVTRSARSPYGDGYAAGRIVEAIKSANLGKLRSKVFYDLPDVASNIHR